MNPADAKKRGLVTGDFVEMRSKFGGPVRARIDVSIIVPEGTIDSQYGWRGDQNTQNLIPRQWDPISGYAPYSEVRRGALPRSSKEAAMSRYGIIFNVDRCIGCEACFVACKEENKVAPGIQWNKIRRIENVGKRVINYYRVSCQHCEDPACMKVCPAKAISKGPHGEVLVDQQEVHRLQDVRWPPARTVRRSSTRTAGPDTSATRSRSSIPSPRPISVRVPGKAEHCTLCTASSRRRASARLRRKLLDQGPDARRLRLEGSRSPGAHQALHLPLRRGGNAAQGPLHLLEHGLQVRQAEVGFLTDVLF